MGDRRDRAVLAPYFELGARLGGVHSHPGDGHRPVGQARMHGAGDDAHLAAVGVELVARISRPVGVGEDAEDLEALRALEAVVLLRPTEAGLPGRYREVEAKLPKRVARA